MTTSGLRVVGAGDYTAESLQKADKQLKSVLVAVDSRGGFQERLDAVEVEDAAAVVGLGSAPAASTPLKDRRKKLNRQLQAMVGELERQVNTLRGPLATAKAEAAAAAAAAGTVQTQNAAVTM